VKAAVPNWLMTLRLFTFKSRVILLQRESINLSSCPVFHVGSQYYCLIPDFFFIVLSSVFSPPLPWRDPTPCMERIYCLFWRGFLIQ
jgi:hypothetical protein